MRIVSRGCWSGLSPFLPGNAVPSRRAILKMNTDNLTIERLKTLLHYNKVTGVFTWRVSRRGTSPVGSIAGSVPNSDGYIQIKIDGVLHKAHRLAWFYVTGIQPASEVDHKNRDRTDNRFRNLRLCDEAQQAWNRSTRSDNTSGMAGVSFKRDTGNWIVRIQKRGIRLYVGEFSSKSEAIAARRRVSATAFGEYSAERSK